MAKLEGFATTYVEAAGLTKRTALSTFALDVADYDSWESGSLGMESLDPGQLLRDVAYEESSFERVGEARGEVVESGWDWTSTRDLIFGGAAIGAMAFGYVPSAALKAGLGSAKAIGMLSSFDAASRVVKADELSAAARVLRRNGVAVDQQSLADGANDALLRLGFWREPGVIPGGGAYSDDVWDASMAAGEVAAADREAGRIRLFHGISSRSETPSAPAATVDDILQSVLKDGLMSDPQRRTAGPYVWASSQPVIARNFSWGDKPDQTNLTAVVEFVTDPARVTTRNGFPAVDRVPVEDIAAIHFMDTSGGPTGTILATKQVGKDLGSILDDVKVSRKADGGFTWNPRNNQFEFSEGYSSGISPLHTLTIPVEEFTAADIVGFLSHKGFGEKTVGQLLAADPSKMIGGWVDDGLVYLDVSKIFGSEAEARRVGQRLGELSIYDFAKGDVIWMDPNLRPSPFMRAAIAGGAEADDTILASIRAEGLEDFFTGKVGGAELRPELTPIFFGDMTSGQKRYLAQELLKEAPARQYTADDFDNPVLAEWVRREQAYLKGLGRGATKNLGFRTETKRIRGEDGEWVKKTTKSGKVVDATVSRTIVDRTQSPLVDFWEDFKLERPPLSSRVSTAMHRKITKAILKGDVRAVAEVLAVQSNNLAKFVGKDALTPNFYPYMAYMTISNAKRAHATLLAPMLASSSAQVGPGGEAGRALRAMNKLAENKRTGKGGRVLGEYYAIEDGVAVWKGGEGSGYDVNVMKATLAMVNNPDWIMNPVTGLSVKTYVYALLKLNPKLSRALVVDTVDIQMRFATKMSPGWDTTKAGEATEIALNQMVSRAMARSMGVPAFSLQENGWGVFRAIRDRFAGTPKSLTFRNQPLGAVYSQIGLPPDLAALYKRNYNRLLAEVRAGRAPHWQEMTKGVLVPVDNLPVELLLPPAVRAKPGYVERFRDMISTADNLGDALRGAQ